MRHPEWGNYSGPGGSWEGYPNHPKESPLKPVDEELEVRHPPHHLDPLYWAMVNDGILELPEELIAPTSK